MSEILSGDDLAAALISEFGPTLTEGPAKADTPGQPRDPQTGQFASAAEDDMTSEGAPPPAEAEEETPQEPEAPAQDTAEGEEEGDIVLELTPELEEYLAKYDGDLGKALQASYEAQALIGRQGNELGDVRKELEAMRLQMEQAAQNQPQPWFPYQNDIDENPQGLVMEALERGDGQTLSRAMNAWASLGPEESFQASQFAYQLAEYQRQSEAQAAAQPSQDTPATPQDIDQAMKGVLERHPDAREYAEEVASIQSSFPTLQEELQYGDSAQKARAFEQLLVIAKGRAATPDTQKAARRLVIKTQEEVRKAKDDAAVISAGNQSAAQAEESDPRQDALDAIFPTPQDPIRFTQTPDGRTVRVIGE